MVLFSQDYWSANASTVTAITNSDTVNLVKPARALYVLTTGNLAILTTRNSAVTLPVTAGQLLPIQVLRVNATGSTATCVALN